jgi:hypothetical protein
MNQMCNCMQVKLLNDYLVIYRDIKNLIALKMEKKYCMVRVASEFEDDC